MARQKHHFDDSTSVPDLTPTYLNLAAQLGPLGLYLLPFCYHCNNTGTATCIETHVDEIRKIEFPASNVVEVIPVFGCDYTLIDEADSQRMEPRTSVDVEKEIQVRTSPRQKR